MDFNFELISHVTLKLKRAVNKCNNKESKLERNFLAKLIVYSSFESYLTCDFLDL